MALVGVWDHVQLHLVLQPMSLLELDYQQVVLRVHDEAGVYYVVLQRDFRDVAVKTIRLNF